MNNSQFIASNSRAHAIYCEGWQAGHTHGYTQGHRDAGDAAELAGRAYYAMSASEAHTRAFAKSAADALTVPRMASKPMPTATIKPTPTLDQFMAGLRRGGVLGDVQAVRS